MNIQTYYHMKMNTRLLFCFLLLLSMTVGAWAQNAFVIYQKDGMVTTFSFAEKPILSYSGNELVLTTTETSVQYPIYMLQKVAFDMKDIDMEDIEDGIKGVSVYADVRYSFREGSLFISGCEPGALVSLYNLKGMKVGQYRLDAEGKATIPLQTLSKDTYIVKAGNLSFKFRQS